MTKKAKRSREPETSSTNHATSFAQEPAVESCQLSKKARKRKRQRDESAAEAHPQSEIEAKAEQPAADAKTPKAKLSKLQESMKRKLEGARFRMINEDLYTKDSQLSFNQFTKDPTLFNVYHLGFREQVHTIPLASKAYISLGSIRFAKCTYVSILRSTLSDEPLQ
jgi:ribosomal RNA-processing protein 8